MMNLNNSVVEILLVEDNENDAELAIHSLKKHNLANNLKWVKDGAEALDFLFHKGEYCQSDFTRPKVVLLDLRLPKIDGIDVLKEIRSHSETHALPVVVLTSSKEEKDLVETYNLGVNSYVPKPISFEEFSKTIAQLGMYWLFINKLPSDMES
jgi:two-component system response regulator